MKLKDALLAFRANAKDKSDKRCAKRMLHSYNQRSIAAPTQTDAIISLLQVMLGRNDKAGHRDIHGKAKE